MLDSIKTFWQVVSSRTFGIAALLALVAAIPLTVFIAQQSQEVRQRASTGFTISGRVFVDTDRNGQMDNGEKGFANATLTIRSPQEGCELPEPSEAPCLPRPACLDAEPPEPPCLMPEPIGGWCEDVNLDDECKTDRDCGVGQRCQPEFCTNSFPPVCKPSRCVATNTFPPLTPPPGCYYKYVECPLSSRPCIEGEACPDNCKPTLICPDQEEPIGTIDEDVSTGGGVSGKRGEEVSGSTQGNKERQKDSKPSRKKGEGSKPRICSPQALRIGIAQTNENGLYSYPVTTVSKGNVHTVELAVPEGYELTTPPNPKKANPAAENEIDFGIATSNISSPTPIGGGCTLDAKICPDGSYVGRVPPSCEFAPCPGTSVCPTPPSCDGRLVYGDPFPPNRCPVYKCIPLTPTPSGIRGDLDGNGIIDLVDFNIMLTCIKNKDCPQKDKADLNGDGAINEADWNILIREYLSRQRR